MAIYQFCVCVVLFGCLGFGTAQNNFKPQIKSRYETIVVTGENYTVTCEGDQPLTWTIPDPLKKNNYTTFTTIDVAPGKKSGYKYAQDLIITNMTYVYTGFYYCHYKNADKDSERESNKVYIYGQSNFHLSVTSEEEILSEIVTQYEEAVISCRPTSPDIKVTLEASDGTGIDYASYSPTIGFRFNVTELSQAGFYNCIFKSNTTESELNFYIHVIPAVNDLAIPTIYEESGGHTVIGDPLVLKCIVSSDTSNIKFEWITPTSSDFNNTNPPALMDDNLYFQKLVINKTTLNDQGAYFCNINDRQGHSASSHINVTIYDEDDHFIYMTEGNGVYDIQVTAGQPLVQWAIDIKGHPTPKLTWYNNRNEEIKEDSTKYTVNVSSIQALLKIKDISISDFGNYTLEAETRFEKKNLTLFLNVTDRPSVHIETDNFHLINTSSTVRCIVAAYPPPDIYLEYKACQEDTCKFAPIEETSWEQNGLQFISSTEILASESGFFKCKANNSEGTDESVVGFYVSDVEEGFSIFGLDSTVDYNSTTKEAVIAERETISMTCGASLHNYSNIQWFYEDRLLTNDKVYQLQSSRTKFSNKLSLTVPNIDSSNSGTYSCKVASDLGEKVTNITYDVRVPTPPFIINSKTDTKMELNFPEKFVLRCDVVGIPKPSIKWFKNDATFNPSNKRFIVSQDMKQIVFSRTDVSDEGSYKCEGSNKLGTASKVVSLKFKNTPPLPKWMYYIIAVLVLTLLGLLIFITYKIRNEKKLQRELKKMGLANFEKGAIENFNPELGVDDQAELLPYDKKWEFPIDNLKLGKQLGSGAFGVVMKGEAKNIVEGEPSTTVAVKMVKKNADHTYIKALASELKIMVHLGKHINVVNLLGACTKNVAKRELLVMVEYCRYGNLHNYLLKHRSLFINQIDPKRGKIDYAIGQEILERTYSVSSNRSANQSPLLKYAALTFSNSSVPHPHFINNEMADYRANESCGVTGATARTDMTTLSTSQTSGDDGMVLSNNSIQPEWRSNYKGDYKGDVRPICTQDLLTWAFQVARGMDYLASRKVLHGDLAARNILLADNNIVKICDFGLAKSMYKSDNYKKRGDGPLPVKWMAIESIRDRVFSTQSDVWSFGIVLWEFFSLARTPYPGMEADERLYHKLVEGYRMESPECAPKEIYRMMLDCWLAQPLSRPTFTKLADRIGILLEDSVRRHYIDLNDPYLKMNTERIEDGQSDYLAMLCPPDFQVLSSPHSPHYVNESVAHQPVNEDEPGYLCMKPSTIFSPRLELENDHVFDFNLANRNKQKNPSVEANGQELLPMLNKVIESDCESPTSPDCFSNPSYHVPPTISETTSDKVDKKCNDDLIVPLNGYVNLPQNRSPLNGESKISPYGKGASESIRHYVNNNSRDWDSVNV